MTTYFKAQSNSRKVWVVEWRWKRDGKWYPFHLLFTRRKAREFIKKGAGRVMEKGSLRIRKYIPTRAK